MISVDEALAIVGSATPRLSAEDCSLRDALGRVLARDLSSDVDWPPFDTSAMDGYAVHTTDLEELLRSLPERSRILAAGDAPGAPLEAGEVVRVMTGAPIPDGTEAIVPVEITKQEQGRVLFSKRPEPGAHIRRRGESIRAGTRLLAAGRRLGPGDIALAALAGADPIRVVRRPRVTIAVTGNELVETSDRPGPGQLRDSNGPMLAALCRERGLSPSSAGSIPDEPDKVERLFATAGESEDVLLTSGGVSAGDLDLLPEVARRCGFDLLFHRVSVKPGKPVAFGRRGPLLWFGLPGNPVSSAVVFRIFVRFALDRLEGDSRPGAPRIHARLARALSPAGPRESYRDGFVSSDEDGLRVEPLTTRGSHDIAVHARANALIRQAGNSGPLEAGAVVECVMIGEVDSRQSTVDSPK